MSSATISKKTRALPADTSHGLSLHEGSKTNGLFEGIQRNVLYIDEDYEFCSGW